MANLRDRPAGAAGTAPKYHGEVSADSSRTGTSLPTWGSREWCESTRGLRLAGRGQSFADRPPSLRRAGASPRAGEAAYSQLFCSHLSCSQLLAGRRGSRSRSARTGCCPWSASLSCRHGQVRERRLFTAAAPSAGDPFLRYHWISACSDLGGGCARVVKKERSYSDSILVMIRAGRLREGV